MPASKEQMERIAKYQKEYNEQILIKPRKEDKISDRIQLAIDRGIAKSKQAYILNAIHRALEADGIPLLNDDPRD